MRAFQSQVKKTGFFTDPNGPFEKWTFYKCPKTISENQI